MKINGIDTTSIVKINGINITSISKILGVTLISTTPPSLPSGLVTSGLIMYLDANYVSGGVNWVDISGSGNNATLVNGPTFDSANGGSIVFDGINDYGVTNNITGPTEFTIGVWCKIDFGGSNDFARVVEKGLNSEWSLNVNKWLSNPTRYNFQYFDNANIVSSNIDIDPTKYQYVVCTITEDVSTGDKTGTIYIDGVFDNSGTRNATLYGDNDVISIGSAPGAMSVASLKGNIPIVHYYNRALSSTEVLQNYISLGGRFLPTPSNSFDAGDTSSYPGSGSTWYNKTGANSATLYNGVSYDTDGGGSLVFDGGSNYAIVPYDSSFDFSTGNYTINTWVKFNGPPSTSVITSKDTNGSNFDWCTYFPTADYIYNYSNGTSTNVNAFIGGSVDLGSGQWYLVTISSIGGYNSMYINGVQYGTSTYMSTSNSDTTALTIGCVSWNNPSLFLNGKIAIMEYYNVGLSSNEVLMSFNKNKTRFGL